MSDDNRKPRAGAATAIGLFLALVVPLLATSTPLLKNVLSQYVDPDSVEYALLREGFFWGLTALVLLVLTIGERQGLAAIGFKRISGGTILWALIGFALAFMSYPVGQYLVKLAGATTNQGSEVGKLLSLPVWMIALIVVRAGVCEEILFRGYGIERLTVLTGSRVIGAVVPALAFMLAHAPRFGLGYVLVILPITTIMTVVYLFRRDLWTNIIAHALVDGVGLGALYMQGHH